LSLITSSRRRTVPEETTTEPQPPVHATGERRTPWRPILTGTLTAVAVLLVFFALVAPDQLGRLTPAQFLPAALLRIPLEGILGAAVLVALPAKARRITAALLGAGLGALSILKVINMGFRLVLGRRFNPVLDWPLLGDGYNYLVETDGRAAAIGAVIGAVTLLLAVVAALALSVLRLARLAGLHRERTTRILTGLLAAWVALALTGVQLFPGTPVASDNVAVLARNTLLTVPAALQDRKAFAATARSDPFRSTPADQLLAGLHGHDVVIGVVESYGRSALEDPLMAAVVDPALAAGSQQLAAAGFSARSAFLTSSTYGGSSWLAHASFQSGLWINSSQRYRQLVSGDRLTVTKSFQKAGWHTVAVEPGNTHTWPEADFYGYNQVWDARNLGYRGPRFGWSRMPDQYTLAAFQQNVYANRQAPLMAEITLTSSHEPWTPLPQLVDWNAVGDGTVYGPMAKVGEKRSVLLKNSHRVRTEYAKSIAYSVGSLTSWTQTYADGNLVLVFFGDHQPTQNVSGKGASHDVPITIVAKDPAVLDRISGWGWQDGLRPDPQAPVWKMSDFRDRFLTAFAGPASSAR
jgi:hypothetical protein